MTKPRHVQNFSLFTPNALDDPNRFILYEKNKPVIIEIAVSIKFTMVKNRLFVSYISGKKLHHYGKMTSKFVYFMTSSWHYKFVNYLLL